MEDQTIQVSDFLIPEWTAQRYEKLKLLLDDLYFLRTLIRVQGRTCVVPFEGESRRVLELYEEYFFLESLLKWCAESLISKMKGGKVLLLLKKQKGLGVDFWIKTLVHSFTGKELVKVGSSSQLGEQLPFLAEGKLMNIQLPFVDEDFSWIPNLIKGKEVTIQNSSNDFTLKWTKPIIIQIEDQNVWDQLSADPTLKEYIKCLEIPCYMGPVGTRPSLKEKKPTEQDLEKC